MGAKKRGRSANHPREFISFERGENDHPASAAVAHLSRRGRHHQNTTPAKDNDPVLKSEKRVIFASTHARAGLERRAALAYEDRPRRHLLTAESLHPAELRIAVATVSSGPLSFFMCHLPTFLVNRLWMPEWFFPSVVFPQRDSF